MKCSSCHENILRDEELKCTECGKTLCMMCTINDKCTCKSDSKEIKLPESIRRSHIDTYESCPYQFYLEVIKGIETPETPYTMIGSDLHELFDKYSWIPHNEFSINDIMKDFEVYTKRYTNEIFKDGEQRIKLMKRAENSIINFTKLHASMPLPYKTEERLYYSLSDDLPSISMAMDRVNKLNDGSYEVIDWKTGATLTGKRLVQTLQVPMYILIIKENYNINISRFRLEYVGEGKSRIYNINDGNTDKYTCTVRKRDYTISLNETIKRLQGTMRDIKRGDYNVKQTQKDFACKHFCSFFEKECQGLIMRQWQQY